MADAASAGSATLSEAAQSILAVGQEAIEASSAEAPQAHDSADIIAPQQEEELDEGAKELQQAADEEAILDEPDAVAQAHLVGQSAGSADPQQEGEPDDENANHQPSAIEEELEDEEGEGEEEEEEEEEEANAGGEAMDEDFQPDENERAQIAEELAGLGDGGERGAADEDVRYRPHSILDDEDDDGDEQQTAERSRKKKKTSHDRSNGEGAAAAFHEADGGEGSQLTEKERRKLELDRRIEQALKAGKKKRGRKADNVDEIDVFSDESVQELKREMMEAATRDEDANISKGLVIEKLKLLPKVMATLQKTHLQQAITDHNLLEGVRRWLEPLPDHSLPALNIQRSFFSALEKMPIDSISLKMSGLGKIMMFYSLNTKVDPKIRRSADRLIEIWSRPIIRKSSSFRDRSMPGADHDPSAVRIMGSQSAAGAGSNSQDASQSSGSTRMRVPQAVTGYSVVPRSAVATMGSGEGPSQARAKNAAKLRTFKSKLKESKQR